MEIKNTSFVVASPQPSVAAKTSTETIPMPITAASPVPDDGKSLADLIKTGNDLLASNHPNRDLTFEVDQKTGKVISRVVDKSTGEVIRQMPSEEMLKMFNMWEKGIMHLLSEKG